MMLLLTLFKFIFHVQLCEPILFSLFFMKYLLRIQTDWIKGIDNKYPYYTHNHREYTHADANKLLYNKFSKVTLFFSNILLLNLGRSFELWRSKNWCLTPGLILALYPQASSSKTVCGSITNTTINNICVKLICQNKYHVLGINTMNL